MNEAKAKLRFMRVAPRKVRLVCDLVRGTSVAQAQIQFDMAAKRAAPALKKLVSSAIANAKQLGMNTENLFIKKLTVDEGPVYKRFMPRAHGRAATIRKRTSHVTLVLGEKS